MDESSEPLEHEHTPEAIALRLQEPTRHHYLRDLVYGAIDGAVTTFAVVSGVAGAGLQPEIVVVLGFANLIGDGFSMAASNYLGTRTEEQLLAKARQMEHRHIQLAPEGEREEVRQIFASKGFQGEDLEKIVAIITANEQQWVETMLVDELGMNPKVASPIRAALATFIAFCVIGMLPLLAFLTVIGSDRDPSWLYPVSTSITMATFFAIGAAKSVFVQRSWIRSGLETLAIGGTAAFLAFLVGAALRQLVDVAA